MNKIKLNIENLTIVKNIFEDIEYNLFGDIKDIFVNTISKKEKRKILMNELIYNKLFLDTDSLKKAMRETINIQNEKTSNEIISKISDIKSSQNFSDFITFTEESDKKYFIIGDLHDDLKSLDQILIGINYKDEFENIHLIFLGDYVDRGKDRLNLINKIVFLKYLLPNNIHLLRGNHELYIVDENGNYFSPMVGASPNSYHFDLLTYLINSDSEKNKIFVKDNNIDKNLIELYAHFFESMPYVALFNFKEIKICAMHGGLPRPDLASKNYYDNKNFDSFNTLLDDKTLDCVGIKQKINLLWTDPYEGYLEGFRNSSEIRFSFNEHQFNHFCKKYDIDLVLRAHESQAKGYKTYFDSRLISVFSSGGTNKDEDKIANTNSYYENVSPNILSIEQVGISSINIDFTNSDILHTEEVFQFENLKEKRFLKEKELSDYIYSFDELYFNNVNENPDIIQIFDMYDLNNKKIIISKDIDKIILNYNSLNQFFGVHKYTNFEIDQKNKMLTNIGDSNLNIDNQIILKNQGISLSSKTVLRIESGASLYILI